MRIEHAGIWAHDVERLRDFYVRVLGGESGPRYENPRTGFHSYFVSFGDGPRLELMGRSPGSETARVPDDRLVGLAHLAFALASREAVDATIARLKAQGVVVLGRPRLTGDGYYEAVVADPEGNRLEFVETR
jgi:catechol 2,3-dioxygenase-like lactoylglutathione lyase family enzyme